MRPMSVVVPDVDVQHALELRACGVRKLDRAPYERDDIACRVRKLDRPHESGSAVSEETRASRGLDMANGIARGPDGAYYASNDFGGGIDRFLNGVVTDNWSQVETPNGLVIDSAGRYLYAAQTFKPASIAQIDLVHPELATTYFAASGADMSAGPDGITRDGADRLYVAANGAGEVWRVDRDRTICVLARNLQFASSVSFGGGKPGFPNRNLYAVTFTGLVVELANVTDQPPA
jgi:hypothetical protein